MLDQQSAMLSHSFSENYMILRPEDVRLLDVFSVLLKHGSREKKGAVHYPEGKKENVYRRWQIFISLVAQKSFQSMSKPLSSFGSMFEMWLNLVSCNGNIFTLLFNAFRGKVVMPSKESETFLSIIGHMDKRIDLDKKIKPGNCRYYSAFSVMAAKLSYENRAFVENVVRNHWKMKLIGHYDFWNDFQKKLSTQATMLHDTTTNPDTIVVAFRGTEPFDTDAWRTDIDISWYEFKGMGKIHGGFMKALGLLMNEGWPKDYEQNKDNPIAYYTIREKLKQILKENDKTKFILTGHSMGGALAILFPAVLAMHQETDLLERLEGVYTFGQPRVGDQEFKDFMKSQLLSTYGFKYLRFVYCNDVVPRLPTDDSTFLFKHFGTCIYYNSCYNGKIIPEEPDKNYLSPFAPVTRFLNAVWELLRGFIMPYMNGPDYAEGWFLKIFRCFGLIFPGVSAHGPQDYVNITRLGSDSLYVRIQSKSLRSISDFLGQTN